jgi:tRNA G18 (ribose-2'-O)-methylase SpoU
LPELVRITDPDDPRIGDYRALTDAALRKRYEHRAGVFIAEGPNVVLRLLESRYPLLSVLLTTPHVATFALHLAGVDVPVYVVDLDVMTQLVRFPLHQGVVAVGGRLPPPDPTEVLAGADRVVVLEEMNDHENMGAIFRTARGLGADAVLLGPHSADPLYRRCVRVSMGHVLHLPFASIGAPPEGLAPLRAAGFTLVALTPDAAARPVDEVPRDGPLALLVGAEGPGLSPTALAAADALARIPMSADVDSLNVAAATAIALHALRR